MLVTIVWCHFGKSRIRSQSASSWSSWTVASTLGSFVRFHSLKLWKLSPIFANHTCCPRAQRWRRWKSQSIVSFRSWRSLTRRRAMGCRVVWRLCRPIDHLVLKSCCTQLNSLSFLRTCPSTIVSWWFKTFRPGALRRSLIWHFMTYRTFVHAFAADSFYVIADPQT